MHIFLRYHCSLFLCSCFANVVLQCLACTRPLTAYLLEKDHSRTCKDNLQYHCLPCGDYVFLTNSISELAAGIRKLEDWCFLCELQAHIHKACQSRQPFSPINILSRIPNIGGNLGYGSQEDAHEFMRFFLLCVLHWKNGFFPSMYYLEPPFPPFFYVLFRTTPFFLCII